MNTANPTPTTGGTDQAGTTPTANTWTTVCSDTRRRGPWRGLDQVELATLEWVDWRNHRVLHTACHDLPPAECEQIYYGQHLAEQTAGVSTT